MEDPWRGPEGCNFKVLTNAGGFYHFFFPDYLRSPRGTALGRADAGAGQYPVRPILVILTLPINLNSASYPGN